MYTSILNTIDDSDKQLGFLFTKRENTHLIQLCEYFDERLHDQIQPVDRDEIDARCTEGTSTIANNKRILWKALKDWAPLLGAPLPVMQKMGAMISALNIPVAEEIAAKPRNLALAGADRKFGNARYARNLFEKLLEHQSNRVAAFSDPTETDISTLEKSDLEAM